MKTGRRTSSRSIAAERKIARIGSIGSMSRGEIRIQKPTRVAPKKAAAKARKKRQRFCQSSTSGRFIHAIQRITSSAGTYAIRFNHRSLGAFADVTSSLNRNTQYSRFDNAPFA